MARGVRKTAAQKLQEELSEVRSAIDQYEDCLKTMREKEKHLCEQIQLEQFKAVSRLPSLNTRTV